MKTILIILWLIFFAALIYAVLPPLSYYTTYNYENNNNTLLVTAKACGCPCAEVRILKGKLDIPKRFEHLKLLVYEMNIHGNNPYEPFNYEIYMQEITLQGKVTSMDTLYCHPENCELVADFHIENYAITSYAPNIFMLGRVSFLVYLFGIFILFVILLVCTLIALLRSINNLSSFQ